MDPTMETYAFFVGIFKKICCYLTALFITC